MDTVNFSSSFVSQLCEEAIQSRAVDHPYLHQLAAGRLPDMQRAVYDFAVQYGAYSRAFTAFLEVLIAQLSNAMHRQLLQHNLEEEEGDTHGVALPEAVLCTVEGCPHAKLFERFQHAAGVNEHDAQSRVCANAKVWQAQFLRLCESNEHVAIGALGLGTELIVSRIYQQILQCLKHHTALTPVERVFFDLHSACDDEHAEQMLHITSEMASDARAKAAIAQGMRAALALRIQFWDCMLERALAMPCPATPEKEKMTHV